VTKISNNSKQRYAASSFLTAYRHILGYSVPDGGVEDAIKE